MIKSLISVHKATTEEVLTRANDVINCGVLLETIGSGNSITRLYKLGRNVYTCGYVCSELRYFGLVNTYLFAL